MLVGIDEILLKNNKNDVNKKIFIFLAKNKSELYLNFPFCNECCIELRKKFIYIYNNNDNYVYCKNCFEIMKENLNDEELIKYKKCYPVFYKYPSINSMDGDYYTVNHDKIQNFFLCELKKSDYKFYEFYIEHCRDSENKLLKNLKDDFIDKNTDENTDEQIK